MSQAFDAMMVDKGQNRIKQVKFQWFEYLQTAWRVADVFFFKTGKFY